MNLDSIHQNCLQDEKNKSDDVIPTVEMAIKEIIEKTYLNYEIQKKKITPEGGNYLGLIYEVSVKGSTAGGAEETHLFIKQAMPTNDNLKIFSLSELYSKEQFVYRQLAGIFRKLQNDVKIPSENRLNMVRFYNESFVDTVILENMTKKGFKTYNKTDIISLKFAELSIKELAKFHALSFVIENNMPEYFERKIKTLKQSINYDYFIDFIKKACVLSIKKLTPDMKTKIEKRLKFLLDPYVKYSQGTMTNVKCLCHGDFKMNNVLLKEINGEVAEVVVVDYQFIYYGSPINDFLFFVFAGTDRKFRKKHLEHLKDVYHDTLKAFLEYFGISVDKIYSRTMFESDFKNCLDYSLVNSIMLLPFVFTADDETPDIGTEDLNNMGFKLNDSFYERMHGIFDDFVEWGYL